MRWKWAIFSDDQRYRYHLTRQWGLKPATSYEAYVAQGNGEQWVVPTARHVLGWIMCNPSTADAQADDPTIAKLTKYSQQWGYDGLWVTNLWAMRSTDWHNLISRHRRGLDIAGPLNDAAIAGMMAHCPTVLLAWGNVATKVPTYRARVDVVKSCAHMLPNLQLQYLLRTKSGAMGHPLYLRDDLRPNNIRTHRPTNSRTP